MLNGLPLHTSPTLDLFAVCTDTELALPFAQGGISAGFPSPAQDFLDVAIDLNRELIRNPSSTFYARVKGTSMQGAGIDHGDLLVIDKSVLPADGKIAVCHVDGEFTVKRIKVEADCCWLLPANPAYKPIRVTSDNDFTVWGMVVYLIKPM